MMKKVCLLALFVVLGSSQSQFAGGACCWPLHKDKNSEENVKAALAAEPDKVLYDQAIKDLQKGRFNVSRLTLQTLITTYPDSEYLWQSKYALAESFYKEGGAANLSQAAIEFKDFITFFPVNPRAADAQMMIAMTYIRQMQKADRDNSQAKLAEMELTRMIENYPDSSLLDEAKTKLRGVEEVLAEGEFKVGKVYLVKRSYPAAISRFKTVIEKYPDYAGTPEVLFSLGEALRESNNEPESAIYYSRIVSEHPFSARVPMAKAAPDRSQDGHSRSRSGRTRPWSGSRKRWREASSRGWSAGWLPGRRYPRRPQPLPWSIVPASPPTPAATVTALAAA